MTRNRKSFTYVPALMAAVVLAGCGVPLEAAPHPVELPGRVNTSPTQGQVPPSQGPATELLYLVRDGHLVAVPRNVPQPPTPEQHLADLLAGPHARDRQQGLTSALLGTDLRLSVRVDQGQAVVELATSLEGTGRTDDILAFAQIVCALTSRGDISSVTFTRGGQHVEVPRADSSLTRNPLTAADYAPLIATP